MNGKVLNLYMTIPEQMRSGYRIECDSFECDENGIIGDVNYENPERNAILLLSKKSYDLIDQNELYVDKGVLLENIYVDIDINHLGSGSLVEIGEVTFEVVRPCRVFNYLYALCDELPEILKNDRGVIVKPLDGGSVTIGSDVEILKEV